MIDDKKIEEAAINKCGFISSEFYSGAKWAINEFLNDLWHPNAEDPKMTNQENEFVECLVKFKDGIVCLYDYDTWHHWWCSDENTQTFLGQIDKWLYIDDLLTKEGGNHD